MEERQTGSDTTSLASAALSNEELTLWRKRPVVIEARQLDRQTGPRVAEWCGGQWCDLYGRGDRGEDISCVYVETLEGRMRADLGDWIIKGVKGEFYPCKADIFAATYEPATAEQPAAHITPEPGADCYVGTLMMDSDGIDCIELDEDLPTIPQGTRFHCFPILERGEGE